jgi:tRNA pseudouridine32 synthase/23S rRNA pseudouridine746 synthase
LVQVLLGHQLFGANKKMQKPGIITFKKFVKEDDPKILIDFLEKESKLSKSILKKVLNNGGVWLKKFKSSKMIRVRRATMEIFKDSSIEFYYDPELMSIVPPEAKVLLDQKEWGIWFKPQGLLSQGTDFADHCTILRQVEKIKGNGNAYAISRLDREAFGLIFIAYTDKAARIFTKIWQDRKAEKIYKVEVLGNIKDQFPEGYGEITLALDGKDAKTTFTTIEANINTSKLLVQIHTGRLHQIRKHFHMIGFPVMGDPRYGTGNKNQEGLRLLSFQLNFRDPLSDKQINFALDDISF